VNDKWGLWDNVHKVIIEEIEFTHKKGKNIQAGSQSEKKRS